MRVGITPEVVTQFDLVEGFAGARGVPAVGLIS